MSDIDLACDVCIVGSGAGGAVLGHALTERGLSVMMLEEGGHYTSKDFDMREETAYARMYQDLGSRTTDDLAITMLQGKSVGGSTTVNWCTCFRMPDAVLAHWRDRFGLRALTPAVLAPHFEALEAKLHIAQWPEALMNANNRVLWEGCGALGYQRDLVRRNVHACQNLGYCGLGCPVDAKQSMNVTLIPEAVQKGMRLIPETRVEALEWTGRRVTKVHGRKLVRRSDGAQVKGPRVTIRPKVTAVCAGAVGSPLLLLRSGLSGGGQAGKRMFLHPTVVMMAHFDKPIHPHQGAPQSVTSHHFRERGSGRIGFFMETPPVHPLLAAVTLPGYGEAHQQAMTRLPHSNVLIALLADGFLPQEAGGTVALRRGDERPSLKYSWRHEHWEAMREACKAMARVQFAAGAREVRSLHAVPVVMRSVSDIALLDQAPWEPLRVRVVSAHVMGGCAMGSVVDEQLRYKDLDNLFVVDGSVFPTSLGVNPQLSIFGIARWAATHVGDAVSHP